MLGVDYRDWRQERHMEMFRNINGEAASDVVIADKRMDRVNLLRGTVKQNDCPQGSSVAAAFIVCLQWWK